MPHDEPDWRLITRPPADRRAIVRALGLLVMTAGVVILAIATLQPDSGLDRDGGLFSLGLVLYGGFLRQ
jgi:hypothetical protein